MAWIKLFGWVGPAWPHGAKIGLLRPLGHGSTFSLITGEPQTLPATQPVPVYVARVLDGDVVIDIETGALS